MINAPRVIAGVDGKTDHTTAYTEISSGVKKILRVTRNVSFANANVLAELKYLVCSSKRENILITLLLDVRILHARVSQIFGCPLIWSDILLWPFVKGCMFMSCEQFHQRVIFPCQNVAFE